jgi:excisionase family DNA binding protein
MLDREMARQIVNVRKLANYLHCHPSTVYRLAKHGDLSAFRLGGHWRFKISDIESVGQDLGQQSVNAVGQVRVSSAMKPMTPFFRLISPPPAPQTRGSRRSGTRRARNQTCRIILAACAFWCAV